MHLFHRRVPRIWLVCLILVGACAAPPRETVATFSIVAFDPETGDLGVAVASKFLAVGSVVPWAEAGVGAVATQSYANVTYGPAGLKALREGKSAAEALNALVDADKGREHRQAAIVDAKGRTATFTGSKCFAWAGGKTGRNWAAQGNILTGPEVIDAMGKAFEEAEGELAERLLTALAAGEKAGGDKRGKQSAALYVVRKKGGFLGGNDRYIDLRVDDHTDPVADLARLLRMHRELFRQRR
jgi:uncharacterized Ntn-hydrolase superfamily protein